MKYLTKRAPAAALLLSLALILSACGKQAAPDAEDSVISSAVTDAQDPRSDAASSTASAAETVPAAESGSAESEAESSPSSGSTSMQEIPVIPAESTVSEPEETGNGYTIVSSECRSLCFKHTIIYIKLKAILLKIYIGIIILFAHHIQVSLKDDALLILISFASGLIYNDIIAIVLIIL